MSRDIIFILALALIVVAGWISIDLYKAYTETQAPVVSEEVMKPINPEIDFAVIQDLESRVEKSF